MGEFTPSANPVEPRCEPRHSTPSPGLAAHIRFAGSQLPAGSPKSECLESGYPQNTPPPPAGPNRIFSGQNRVWIAPGLGPIRIIPEVTDKLNTLPHTSTRALPARKQPLLRTDGGVHDQPHSQHAEPGIQADRRGVKGGVHQRRRR